MCIDGIRIKDEEFKNVRKIDMDKNDRKNIWKK